MLIMDKVMEQMRQRRAAEEPFIPVLSAIIEGAIEASSPLAGRLEADRANAERAQRELEERLRREDQEFELRREAAQAQARVQENAMKIAAQFMTTSANDSPTSGTSVVDSFRKPAKTPPPRMVDTQDAETQEAETQDTGTTEAVASGSVDTPVERYFSDADRESFLRSGVDDATDSIGRIMTQENVDSIRRDGGGIMEMEDGTKRFIDEGITKQFMRERLASLPAEQAAELMRAGVVPTEDGFGIVRGDTEEPYTVPLTPSNAEFYLNSDAAYALEQSRTPEGERYLPESDRFAQRRAIDSQVALNNAQGSAALAGADAQIMKAQAEIAEQLQSKGVDVTPDMRAAIRRSMDEVLSPIEVEINGQKVRVSAALANSVSSLDDSWGGPDDYSAMKEASKKATVDDIYKMVEDGRHDGSVLGPELEVVNRLVSGGASVAEVQEKAKSGDKDESRFYSAVLKRYNEVVNNAMNMAEDRLSQTVSGAQGAVSRAMDGNQEGYDQGVLELAKELGIKPVE